MSGRNFRSYLMAQTVPRRGGAYYGEAGSTRLDVIERVDGTTVCVYDIKTGKRGLSMTRVLDLGSAGLKYSGANTVIVVQVNPE